MKTPLRHVLHYILLCLVLSAIIVLLIYANGNPKIQKLLVIVAGGSYILWGYLHHYTEKTLDLSVIVEYALYGILGSFLILGLI